MKKYAVIDIGSNTVRMVVYAVEENDTFHALFSKKYTLGLAGYVQDGVMSQEGIHRLPLPSYDAFHKAYTCPDPHTGKMPHAITSPHPSHRLLHVPDRAHLQGR